MPGNESPIFARGYDLLRWLIPLTLKFPRQQRFVLAAAVQQSALRLHERLIEAAHAKDAPLLAALGNADVELDKLRHYLRLCHDLDLITAGQYEHAAVGLAEIGRLLGGWRKAAARQS
ncbi:MAG: diversity-generating retroelement protein Avd [Ktedonobacterales bacterium]|nr:diversity-generating retroelement protein Avd [Ktedonobacterales bacterium]